MLVWKTSVLEHLGAPPPRRLPNVPKSTFSTTATFAVVENVRFGTSGCTSTTASPQMFQNERFPPRRHSRSWKTSVLEHLGAPPQRRLPTCSKTNVFHHGDLRCRGKRLFWNIWVHFHHGVSPDVPKRTFSTTTTLAVVENIGFRPSSTFAKAKKRYSQPKTSAGT